MIQYQTYTKDRSVRFDGEELSSIASLKWMPLFGEDSDVNSARQMDVVWFGKDGNPLFFFEVEHTVDFGNALNKLAMLSHLNAALRVVGPDEMRSLFEVEMQKLHQVSTSTQYGFISYSELAHLYETAIPFITLRNHLLGNSRG